MNKKFCIKNNQHNTFPFLVHAQNLRLNHVKNFFEELSHKVCNSFLPKSQETDLSVVTITNNKNESPLFHVMKKMNHKNFYIFGQDIVDWDFYYKIEILKTIIPTINTKYFLFCDSHDVLPVKLNGIVDAFLNRKCDALFNAEYGFWPNEFDFRSYNEGELPFYITCKGLEAKIAIKHGCLIPMYLNSGLWIASKEYANYLVNLISIDYVKKYKFSHGEKVLTNDQPYYREVFHQTYPNTMLDYRSNLFQTLVGEIWNNQENTWQKVVEMKKVIRAYHHIVIGIKK